MANTKKYVSLEKLSLYDENIKKVITDGDAATLTEAKAFAEGLATNYDTAGSAASALAQAQAYADGKDGAIAEAKQAGLDAAAAASVADGKAVAAQTAADNAQTAVDNLDAYVGDIPEGYTQETVIAYINKKAEETLAAAQGGSSETAASVKAQLDTYKAENDAAVEAIEGDVADLEAAIATEQGRAEGIEAGLDSRLKAVEDDYLKAADKTELQNNINTVSGAVERLTNGVSAEEIDGVNDLIQYVKDHGTEVTGMQGDISKNAEDIAAEIERAKGEEAKNAQAAADAKTAAENAQAAAEAEAERATGVEGGLDTRLKVVEAAVGESDSIAADIATTKQEAIDAAAIDATTKANTAEANAKGHATSLNTAMDARVQALEAVDHNHDNKAELDLIVAGDKAKWDQAADKAHDHGNKDVIDNITSAKVTAWDAAESNAKNHADGLNTAMDSRVASLETWHTNFIEVSEEEINSLFA